MIKRVLAIGLLFLFATPSVSFSDTSLTLGGGTNRGHTYSSHNSLGDGISGFLSYQKRKDYNDLLRWGYGATLYGFQFTKRDNDNGTEDSEYALIPSGDVSLYVDYFDRLKPFVRTGAGLELSTDEAVSPVGIISAGFEYKISKNFSVGAQQAHAISEKRRHGLTVFSITYTW